MTQSSLGRLLAPIMALSALAATSTAQAANWTGCYAGIGATYGATVMDTSLRAEGTDVVSVDGLGADGPGAALFGGCDMRIDRFVFGLFADYTWHDQQWSVSSALLPGTIATIDVETQWTAGGRVGFVLQPNAMVYGLAGYTELSLGDLKVPVARFSASGPTLSGLVLGAGAEIEITSGLMLQLEYRYAMLNDGRIPLDEGVGLDVDAGLHSGRLGLLYRFDFLSR